MPKAKFDYKLPAKEGNTFEEVMVGEMFRQMYTSDRNNPCLYIKTARSEAVSLRSGAICALNPGTQIVLVNVTVTFKDC
jgi:hypothetical protein